MAMGTNDYNTDFSGIFTLEDFSNSKTDVVYAEDASDITADLRQTPKQKYSNGIIFWGAIPTNGLIPNNGPINVTEWLNNERLDRQRKRMYMTGELYATFLREKAITAIKSVIKNLDDVIFQDDQDSKQRTQVAMSVIDDFLKERIEPDDGDAKIADVWPIENMWGMMREKTRGKTFQNLNSLLRCINSEWRKSTPEQYETMIDKIPLRLTKVIQSNRSQIYEH